MIMKSTDFKDLLPLQNKHFQFKTQSRAQTMANSLYQPTFMAQKEKTVAIGWKFYTQKSLDYIRQVKYSS